MPSWRRPGVITERTHDDLVEAFRILWRIRLEHHVERIERGALPDDFVDPKSLSRVALGSLGDSLRVIADAQATLAKKGMSVGRGVLEPPTGRPEPPGVNAGS